MAIPVDVFFLDREADGTLQQKLQQQIAESILAGRFLPGERMPSSRSLARHLGVSRITVTVAYNDLVADDYLIARGRSGYFVSDTAPVSPRFETPRQPAAGEFDWGRIITPRYAGFRDLERPRNWRNFPYAFIYGQADPGLLDHQNWRLCALQALGQKDFGALIQDQYERDDARLVEYILRHILPRRGIVAAPENILITLGAQNALWMAAELILSQRRTAAMENPCYPGLREILHQARCRTVAIDVDDDGLPPEALPDEVDAVFTTPSHQCPTNATMPLARRKALLRLSRERGFVIVEDDYEFEISFSGGTSPALKSLDEAGSVIYIGSFSKSLFPGLRLGFMVAPPPLIREARALRALVLRHPPGHIQRTAAYFLSLGHYDAQINRMRKAYRARRDVMETAIRDAGLTPAGADVPGGSSFWMRAPAGTDTRALASRLHAHGVLIEPGDVFFARTPAPTEYYRLAYSSIPPERIPEGIALIAEALGVSGPTRARDLALTERGASRVSERQ